MNQRNPAIVVLVFVGLISAVSIMTTILLGSGNQIGELCKYLLGASFFIGLLSPRGSLLLLLLLSGYTDLIKRLMIVSGRVSQIDIYYVLGIPPVILVAITLSILFSVLTGKLKLSHSQQVCFFVACGLVLVTAVMAAKSTGGSLGAILPAIANQGLYALLIFIVPVLLHTKEDALRMLKWVLWFFLPVAIYGIMQKVNGYQDFEIAYLKSGMTIEIKQLFFNEVRPFSTLNSPTALAAMCTALCALSIILGWLRTDVGKPVLNRGIALLLAATYFSAWVASTGRAAIVVIVFTVVGWVCFQSLRLTKLLYTAMVLAFVILVSTSGLLLNSLEGMQNTITETVGDGQFAVQLTRVGTYSDRLRGFSNMVTNPKVWTLFGVGENTQGDASLSSHDIISGSFIKHGVVVVFPVLFILLFSLKKLHGHLLKIRQEQVRSIAAGMLALALSFLVLSVLAGSVLVVFPVNVFTFLFCGMVMLMVQISRSETDQASPEKLEALAFHPDLNRKVYPFTRSGNASLR